MAFSSIFQRVPKKMLKIGDDDDPDALFTLKDIQILVMLGYLRQILFLLSYEDNKRILTFLGDIDVLGVLWCKKELKTQAERDDFIRQAVSMNIYDKIVLICTKYYDQNLLEASLFKMFKNSFWNMFEKSSRPKIEKFSENPVIKNKMPFFCETIKILLEYQDISNLEDEKIQKSKFEIFSRKIKGIVNDCMLKEKLENLGYIERYELGIVLCIWYSFFYLKTPPNCPFKLSEEERNQLPLFSIQDQKNKSQILTISKKLKRCLWIIFEKFCLDQYRYTGDKDGATDPYKKGFWSVFLIREIEPLKTKFFKGLGLHKYYVVNKMSQIAILTKQMDVKNIIFLENFFGVARNQQYSFRRENC